MGINVLGALVVDSGRTPKGRRDRVVLEALATRLGHAVGADQLIDAIWGPAPPVSAHKVLQGCIVRLRQVLGADAIQTLPQGYCLLWPPEEIDAQRFESLIVRARERVSLGEPERAEYLVSEALGLWRGPAFDELADWGPGRIAADRLNELRLEGEELRVDALLRAGRFREVLADARAMFNEAPLRERRGALLALAQYQSGSQAEALRILRQMRALLVGTLGVDPSPDIVALEQGILRQDPGLAPPEVAVNQSYVRCPYQGLRPYDIEDSESYFGRDSDVSSCLQRIRADHLVVVVGPSGCGKSSLVRAGVAAALRREGRAVVVVSPGAQPLDALAGVDTSRRGLVLVVDQCEEMFSLCNDEEQRDGFITALVAHAERSSLVVALRADHLADVALCPSLARLTERGLHLVTAMSEDELRQAIEHPARLAGLRIEPGLSDLLVREVENEPGALPLLSHALQETWLRREGSALTIDGYRATGGIKGAVALSAELIYAHTAAAERHLLRDLLVRLVAPGVEGEPVRSRMPRRLLVSDPAQEDLLGLLVAARLVTSDDGVVEIAHEALARAWPRLRAWLDDDVEGLRILHHLTGAADAWEHLGRPQSELYRGVRLAQAREWRHRSQPALTPTEAQFLVASENLAETEHRSAAIQAHRQAQVIRRLRAALGAVAVLLVLAIVVSSVAAHEAKRSQAALRRANEAEATADAHRLGAQALLTSDGSLSDLLALEGLSLADDTVSRSNALQVLLRQSNLIWTSAPLGRAVTGLSVSADGTRVAAYDASNKVSVLDSKGRRLTQVPIAGESADYPKGPLEFSPTQPLLAVGAQGFGTPVVELLSARTLQPLPRQLAFQPKVRSQVIDLDFSIDGRYLAVSLNHKASHKRPWWSIRVWDLSRPTAPPKVIAGHGGSENEIALSDDGRRVYASWPLTGYLVSTGRRLFIDHKVASFVPLDVDSAGKTVAVGNSFADAHTLPFNVVQLRDAKTGELTATLPLPANEGVSAARFSHDGSLLAVGTGQGTVFIWDTTTYAPVLQLFSGRGVTVAVAPDDATMFTAGEDGTVRAWDLSGSRALVTKLPVDGGPDIGGSPLLSPDGTTLAIDTWLTRRDFLDLGTGHIYPAQRDSVGWPLANGEPDGAAWSDDGRVYAVGGTDTARRGPHDGLVETYDATGHLLDSARVEQPVTGLAFAPDGLRLIVAEMAGRVDTLDATTLHPAAPALQLQAHPCCVAVAPDGRRAVVLTAVGRVAEGSSPRWGHWSEIDLADASVTMTGSLGGTDALAVDFSPDSRRIAIGVADGTMRLIDADTGRQLNNPPTTAGNGIQYVTFDSTGDRIATSSANGTITIWDGRTGERQEWLPLGDPGTPMFIDDGKSLLVGADRASAYIWQLGLTSSHVAACRIAGRNLTAQEWSTYLPGRPYERTCPQYK